MNTVFVFTQLLAFMVGTASIGLSLSADVGDDLRGKAIFSAGICSAWFAACWMTRGFFQ